MSAVTGVLFGGSIRCGVGARRGRRLVACALVVGAYVLAGPIVGQAQAAPVGSVTTYTATGISFPSVITAGPDGALWFTNYGNGTSAGSIGRISTSGAVTNYTDPGIKNPLGIAVGPDGALWFTDVGNRSIGRISIGGITTYTGPGISFPTGITSGPDGALWFTNQANDSIGRISTTGMVTNYTDPSINQPVGIAAGPDGALWFTNAMTNSIGRISTTGVVSNYTGAGISDPVGIAAGPDGGLWFTNHENNTIGRISITGKVTNYPGLGIGGPQWIAAGPDGALWFTNLGNNSIGRISTKGAVTNYTSLKISTPNGIAAGPDGGLWFANGTSSIGRIQAPGYATMVSSSPGLLAYWRLGESSGATALDELGNNNGTYVGGHTLGVPGALHNDSNTAVALDGNNGQIQLPSLGRAANWTVEGWTDLVAGASGNNALYGSNNGVRLLIRPASVYADDRTTGSSKAIVQKSTGSNVDRWVYWALVRQGPTVTVYRNATAIGSATLATPAGASALNGAIGATTGTAYLHGNVDEVAVYKRALKPAALLSHYQLAGYSVGLTGKRCAGQAATIVGSAGADRLVGTRGSNVILGGAGNDLILAGGGGDLVCAGAGSDLLVGGRGSDRLLGEAGNDILFGGPGRDVLRGGLGNDRLFGGPGNDRLFGGPGNDRITPGAGRDRVDAGPGNDRIFSRDGQRDVIDCGPGRDVAIVDAVDRTRRCEIVIRAQTPRRSPRPAPRAGLG